jgi:RNA polymerase sigma factor (sigma-70 family)
MSSDAISQSGPCLTVRTDRQRITRQLISLFESEYEALCKLAFVIVGSRSEAEDVVMDAFAKVIRRSQSPGNEAFSSRYLRVAVINQARSAVRRQVLRRRFVESRAGALELLRSEFAPAEEATVDRLAVLEAVLALPLRQRLAVALRYYEGLSENELASVMGCSLGTAKSHLARARRKLRKTLAIGAGGRFAGILTW